MKFLALVHNAWAGAKIGGQGIRRVKASFLTGVDYPLNLQHDSSGWPQQIRHKTISRVCVLKSEQLHYHAIKL